MDKNTKKMLIIGGIGAAAVGFWYFFFGPGATPAASTSATTSASSAPAPTYSAADEANIALINQWIASMPVGGEAMVYYKGILASNPSSAFLAMWAQCLNVLWEGGTLTAAQQQFWNSLSAGH